MLLTRSAAAARNSAQQPAPSGGLRPDPEQRLAYEEYRAAQLARFLASSAPRERFAATFDQKRHEYAGRYRGSPLPQRAARTESEANLISFEDFCRKGCAAAGLGLLTCVVITANIN